MTASLTGYSGSFSVSDQSCTNGNYATVTPASGAGPFTVTGEGTHAWQCTATFSGNGSQGDLTIYVVTSEDRAALFVGSDSGRPYVKEMSTGTPARGIGWNARGRLVKSNASITLVARASE